MINLSPVAMSYSCIYNRLSHMVYDLLAQLPKCDHFSCFPHQMCQFPGRPPDTLLHFCRDTTAYNWFIVGKLLRYWCCNQQFESIGISVLRISSAWWESYAKFFYSFFEYFNFSTVFVKQKTHFLTKIVLKRRTIKTNTFHSTSGNQISSLHAWFLL